MLLIKSLLLLLLLLLLIYYYCCFIFEYVCDDKSLTKSCSVIGLVNSAEEKVIKEAARENPSNSSRQVRMLANPNVVFAALPSSLFSLSTLKTAKNVQAYLTF